MAQNPTKEQVNVKNVDPELLQRARIIAVQQKRKLSDVLRELLAEWVKEQETEAKLKG